VTTEREPDHELVLDVATALVIAGRVVPSLAIENDGRSRVLVVAVAGRIASLPRASLVVDSSAEAQRLAATRLAGSRSDRALTPRGRRDAGTQARRAAHRQRGLGPI
jgi:hypothetical protein